MDAARDVTDEMVRRGAVGLWHASHGPDREPFDAAGVGGRDMLRKNYEDRARAVLEAALG